MTGAAEPAAREAEAVAEPELEPVWPERRAAPAEAKVVETVNLGQSAVAAAKALPA